MGQKVNPKIFRIPFNKWWDSKWFANGFKYRFFVEEDEKIRKFIKKQLKNTGISNIEIERANNYLKITIYTAKPGLIIGKGGIGAQKLKQELEKIISKDETLELAVIEEKDSDLSPNCLLEEAIESLEKRVPYRRVMKRVIERIEKSKAKGGKIVLRGRLDGVEIARQEKMTCGKLPLHTLKADINYSRGTAFTTYGTVGVKIWIYR
jgi:small subunit ribosomal protein S3